MISHNSSIYRNFQRIIVGMSELLNFLGMAYQEDAFGRSSSCVIAEAGARVPTGESDARGWKWENLCRPKTRDRRSEEHTSELQSLMRISYAVFCLKKKKY